MRRGQPRRLGSLVRTPCRPALVLLFLLLFLLHAFPGTAVCGPPIESGLPLAAVLAATRAIELGAATRVIVRAEARALETAGPSESRVGREALWGRPASLLDPFRAIAGSAGLGAQDDFKSDLRVRGGEAAETEVLVDGLPLPQPYHFSGGAGSAAILGGDLVEELRVRTGGFSAAYGDALAGIVEIVTRDDRPEGVTARGNVSTLLAQATATGPAGGGLWTISGRRSHLGLYDRHVVADDIEEVAFHDLLASVRLPLAAGSRLDLSVVNAGDTFRQDLGRQDPGQAAEASLENGQTAARARFEAALGGRTFMTLLASSGRLSARGEAAGATAYGQHEERRDLRISVQRLAGRAHSLQAGLSLGSTRGAIEGSVDDGFGLIPAAERADARTEAAYLEDLWRPSGVASLRYGARAERFSRSGQSALCPRLAFDLRAAEGLSLRVAAGRFVQSPRPEQIFMAAGEPLRLQVADHFIAGIERTWSGGARLTIEAYRKDLKDTVGEAQNRYVTLPELLTRFERGRVHGLDGSLETSGAGPWRLRLDYSYMVARQEKDGVAHPRNADQRHAASLVLGRRIQGDWDLSGAFRYGSGLPYTPRSFWTDGIDFGVRQGDLNSARLPAYHRLDVRLARSVARAWGRLSGYLDLVNVYNRRNVREIGLSVEPDGTASRETIHFQSPFLPVFGMAAEF